MKTAAKWIVGIVLTLALLVLLAGVVVYYYDWNRERPRINRMVSDATGRHFEIRGDLGVDWQRDPQAASGWRRLVPLPMIRAEDVVLGNPDWAEHDNMAEVHAVRFGVELLPLVRKTVVLRALSVQGAQVAIERTAEQNNWTFETKDEDGQDDGGQPWRVMVSDVRISEGHLAYRDQPLALSLDADISTITDEAEAANGERPRYGMAFTFEGRYREADVEGSGKTGEALSLRETDVRFPVQVSARAGKVEADVEGLVGDLYGTPELDLDMRLAAPSMSMLFPLTGVTLPNTRPFETEGHLRGAITAENAVWHYEDFTGTVGKSDIAGSLTYDASGERPSLTGEMRSRLLQFEDLGPLIGVGGKQADPAAPEAEARKGQAKSNKRPGRVLPDDEFLTDRWRAMDLDLRFTGERIVRDAALPFQNVRTHARMQDGVLTLDPLAFGVADGTLEADIRLDGRDKPMQARLRGRVREVQLPRLFPTVEAMQRSAGRIDGSLAIVANGNSIADLLADSGGEFKVYLQSGRISRFLLEAASLNIASAVIAKLFGDEEVRIRCAGADIALKDGLATMRDFRISTEDALIDITGAIDLQEERLALDVKPETNSLRLISLRTPLYVNGSFADPQIGLEKGPLLARAGAVAALIAAAPAAVALLPITVPGSDEQVDCGELLAAARRAPTTDPDTSAPIMDKTIDEEEAKGEDVQRGQRAPQPQSRPARREAPAAGEQRFGNGGGAPTSTLRAR